MGVGSLDPLKDKAVDVGGAKEGARNRVIEADPTKVGVDGVVGEADLPNAATIGEEAIAGVVGGGVHHGNTMIYLF